jgi:hypothetical protein
MLQWFGDGDAGKNEPMWYIGGEQEGLRARLMGDHERKGIN